MSSIIKYSPLAGREITSELFDQNFMALAQYTEAMDQDLEDLAKRIGEVFDNLHTRVKTLENIELVVKAPKSSKLFLLTVCGVSAYVGYKYADRKFQESVKKRVGQMKQSIEDLKTVSPAEVRPKTTEH